MGKSKNTMVIGYRQKIIEPGINPSSLGSIIATRTMAIAAGVVSFFQMAAGIADLPVCAELTAPAVFNIIHDFMLSWMQPVFRSELITVFPEDIANSWAGCRFIRKGCMAVVRLHRLSKSKAEEIRGERGARIMTGVAFAAVCK
jgi:hypothetical protein